MNIPFNVYVSKAFDVREHALSADVHYSVTSEGSDKSQELLFRNSKTGSKTVLYRSEVERAMQKGWLIKE